MQVRKLWERYGDYIAVGLTILCNIVLISLLFDFYYDLNDDVLIKDIMAGVYTGTPEAHNMQTLYVLGVFVSLFYRLWRNAPWYGLFLCLCQFGSLYLVGTRLLRLCKRCLWKGIWLLMLTLFVWSVLLVHMTAVQYTLTSGIMTAAAIFLFITTEKGLSAKVFWLRNIPSILLVILAFQLRTEMLLLLFPLVALAGFFHWLEDGKFWQKDNFLRYGSVLGTILLGMACSLLIDLAAYGSPDWKNFREFFNKRTEVYDYHLDIVMDGTHTEQLAELGFTESAQTLLDNYNFGLDDSIDAQAMGNLAVYADAYAAQNTDMRTLLTKQIGQYRYRILHLQDGPYSILMLLGFSMVFGVGLFVAAVFRGKGRIRFLVEALLLIAVRTSLWLFIMMRGRDPVRITHPLYLTEFAVLMGMVFLWLSGTQSGDIQWVQARSERQRRNKEKAAYILVGIWALAMLGMVPDGIKSTRQDMLQRRQANEDAQAIAVYCGEHSDGFYFEDVYSTVTFSQEMFRNVDNSLSNYDIMGGWICKSPIYQKKLAHFGMTSMAEGLLHGEGVYMIMKDALSEGSTDWLEKYYLEQGVLVEVSMVDRIGDHYGVYQIREVQ